MQETSIEHCMYFSSIDYIYGYIPVRYMRLSKINLSSERFIDLYLYVLFFFSWQVIKWYNID